MKAEHRVLQSINLDMVDDLILALDLMSPTLK